MIAITDIILALAGLIAGFTAGRLSKIQRTPQRDPSACTCGHYRGMHAGGTGKCQGRTGHHQTGVLCTCQLWDGPERPEDIIRGFQQPE